MHGGLARSARPDQSSNEGSGHTVDPNDSSLTLLGQRVVDPPIS